MNKSVNIIHILINKYIIIVIIFNIYKIFNMILNNIIHQVKHRIIQYF